jgi:hypothetical protein
LTGFGVGFWKDALRERGYTVVEERLDLETLAKQRVVPSSHLVKGRDSPSLMEAILFYRDRYVEAAALVYDRLQAGVFALGLHGSGGRTGFTDHFSSSRMGNHVMR